LAFGSWPNQINGVEVLARDLSLFPASDYQELHARLTRVRRMLTALLQSIENSDVLQATSQRLKAKS
jgi:hypothetical protein